MCYFFYGCVGLIIVVESEKGRERRRKERSGKCFLSFCVIKEREEKKYDHFGGEKEKR